MFTGLLSLAGEAQLPGRVSACSAGPWTGAFSQLWPMRKRQVCQGPGGGRNREQGCQSGARLPRSGGVWEQAQEGLRGPAQVSTGLCRGGSGAISEAPPLQRWSQASRPLRGRLSGGGDMHRELSSCFPAEVRLGSEPEVVQVALGSEEALGVGKSTSSPLLLAKCEADKREDGPSERRWPSPELRTDPRQTGLCKGAMAVPSVPTLFCQLAALIKRWHL